MIEKKQFKLAFQVPPAVQVEVPLPITKVSVPGEQGTPEPTFPGLPSIIVARGGERRSKLQYVGWDEDAVDYNANRDEDLSQGGHTYNFTPDTQWGSIGQDDKDAYGLGYGGGESVPAR